MTKVLLVDDEIFTIRMLQNLVHWKELGLEVAGYAQNGEEAYRKVMELEPEIIISDIKMPGMSGLEFIRKVNSAGRGVKTILMSAYADFSYVKEGIKLGCNDYILKPVDETELEQTLRKVVLEIQGEKEQEKVVNKSERQLNKINLYQYMKSGNGIQKVKRHSNILNMDMQNYFVVILQINNATINEYNSTTNIELGQEGYIANILEGILSRQAVGHIIFEYEEGCWTLIVESKPDRKQELFARELIDQVKSDTGIQMNICFSVTGKRLEELPGLYDEVKNLSKYSFYIGEEDILGYGYNCDKRELDRVRDIGMLRDMEEAVRNRDREKVYVILNEAFEQSTAHFPGELGNIYELCYQTILAVRKLIPEEHQKGERYREYYEMTYKKLLSDHSLKELKTKIFGMIDSIPGFSGCQPERKYSKTVMESIAIIEQRYKENLSLEEICEEIAVSKNYFCYLFKRETGMSVWNYLTVIRLQHAKKMLENTELKNYEIAFEVGYDNPSYFSRLFKKYENVTPNEYRESRR